MKEYRINQSPQNVTGHVYTESILPINLFQPNSGILLIRVPVVISVKSAISTRGAFIESYVMNQKVYFQTMT